MYTPTNSQITYYNPNTSTTMSTRRDKVKNNQMSLHLILQQLDKKIGQISQLKGLISDRVISQELQESNKKQQLIRSKQKQLLLFQKCLMLTKYYKNQAQTGIIFSILQQYQNKNMECVMEIIKNYQSEIKKYKNYYQGEIWDLREEIKRQYKVIAMMKQEVQDLMILMKYNSNKGIIQNQRQQEISKIQNYQQSISLTQWPQQMKSTPGENNIKNNSYKLNGLNLNNYNSDLEVIQQETQRTLQSSERSQRASDQYQSTRNFIRIQEKEQQYETQNQNQNLSIGKSQNEKGNIESSKQARYGKDNSKYLRYQGQWQNKQQKVKQFKISQCQKNNQQEFNQQLTPKQQQKLIIYQRSDENRYKKGEQSTHLSALPYINKNQEENCREDIVTRNAQVQKKRNNHQLSSPNSIKIIDIINKGKQQGSNKSQVKNQRAQQVRVFSENTSSNQKPQQILCTSNEKSDKRQKKTDHLQSIFFLDDQPQQHFNKTCKMRFIQPKQKNQAQNYLNNLSQSQQPHQSQNFKKCKKNKSTSSIKKYFNNSIQQIKNESKNNHVQSKKYFCHEKLNDKSKQIRILDISSEIQGSLSKSGSSPRSSIQNTLARNGSQRQKMKSTSTRHLTQEQTADYIAKKFNKMIPIGQILSSSSTPVSSLSSDNNSSFAYNHNILQELSSNVDYQRQDRNKKNIDQKPKTKQFLQEFRKTFNKCIKSMQVSKKNSTKLNHSASSKSYGKGSTIGNQEDHEQQSLKGNASGVMTFGKYAESNNYQREKQLTMKQNHKQRQQYQQINRNRNQQNVKAVDHMLKQLQNNNKFIIGNKKLELKYDGQKKNGIRCGNGILYYSNGLCYEGEFRDGMRHGYGILKFNHIQIYNGDWHNDEIQGQGKIRNCAIINKKKTIYSTQSPLGKWISYSGQFKHSKFQGSGTLYLQGGQKFVGSFSNGYACGEGSIYKKNGQVEHGTWRNNILIDITKQRERQKEKDRIIIP